MHWSPVRSATSWLCGAALVLGAGGNAAGQAPHPSHEDAAPADSDVLLRDRNRARMHPGDPMEVIGLEQGDNDLRSRTPALEKSNRAVLSLDADDQYQRTLAMYDRGASFSQPAKSAPNPPSKSPRSVWRRAIAPPDEAGNPSYMSRGLLALVLSFMLAGIVVVLRRQLNARRA